MLDRSEPMGTSRATWLSHQSSELGVLGLASFAAIFAYVLTFVQVGFPLLKAVEFALLNVLSAFVPGVIAWNIVRWIQQAAPTLQAALHLPLSIAYSWVWYFVGRFMGSVLDVLRGYDWAIGWLPANALAWQLTQGVSVYAAIVAAAYAVRSRFKQGGMDEFKGITKEPVVPEIDMRTTRFLAKSGDGFTSLNVSEIVLVEGADDYAEVTVVNGEQLLVRLSLKAFEAQLGSQNFVRVHRSVLLALDQLVSAEPAGAGRMLLHLTTGRVVRTSREGARKLRARMI